MRAGKRKKRALCYTLAGLLLTALAGGAGYYWKNQENISADTQPGAATACPVAENNPARQLLLAIQYDERAEFKRLLESGIDANSETPDGWSALFLSALEGRTFCIKHLLAAPGIDVNKAEPAFQDTPLLAAAAGNYTDCVRLLLDAPGVDVNRANTRGDTPLALAADYGHKESLELLLAAPGIRVNQTDLQGNTALHRAAQAGHHTCVELLLAVPGIDRKKRNQNGKTAYSLAKNAGQTRCMAILASTPNASPESIAPVADAYANPAGLKELIAAGEDVNEQNKFGRSALFEAAEKGLAESVRILLAAPDIDVNQSEVMNDVSPLLAAVNENHIECVKLLLAAKDIDVNQSDKHLQTPLGMAAYRGHTEIVKLLLAVPGIDVNCVDECGDTPLSSAIFNGHYDCVKLLLEKWGIDTRELPPILLATLRRDTAELQNILQQTPKQANTTYYDTPLLHVAVLNNLHECLSLLLATPGIDVNATDAEGNSALFCAVSHNKPECLKLLLDVPGIHVNAENGESRSPLCRAAENGYTECVKLLLKAPGIDINRTDSTDSTPLHNAILEGHCACAELLLAAPGIDTGNMPPLLVAALRHDMQTLENLLQQTPEAVNTRYHDIPLSGIICSHNLPECLSRLLGTPGIDLNAQDWYGRTPLIRAAEKGHTACVKLLLEAPGIDTEIENLENNTALESALMRGHTECAELIRSATCQ